MVNGLRAFMAYCHAARGNKEGTIIGKLQAVNFYHELWVGLSLPLGHILLKVVRQGIKRAHPKLQRPFPWEIIKE